MYVCGGVGVADECGKRSKGNPHPSLTFTLELPGPQAGNDNGSCFPFSQLPLARKWEGAELLLQGKDQEMREAKGQEPNDGSRVSPRKTQDLPTPTQFLLCPEGNGCCAPGTWSLLPFHGRGRGHSFMSWRL